MNSTEKKLKTLAIDARPLARGEGGIQRYLRKLLPTLIESGEYKIVLYSDHTILNLTAFQKTHITLREIQIPILSTALWHLLAPIWARVDKIDTYWSPRHHLPLMLPKSVFKIITIHDLVWKRFPSTMPISQLLMEKFMMPFSIHFTDKIICISQTTRKQLTQYFPESTSRSTVVLHGSDKVKISNPTHRSNRTPYFLAVGTLEPRKNYVRLLKGFEVYASQGGKNKLAIVGKIGWRQKSILNQFSRSNYQDRIEFKGSITDAQLESMYQNAQSFVSVSVDEGYGLPPQEAINYGLPLMLSDIAVYRELYPSADIWVNPLSPVDIALNLEKLSLRKAINTREMPAGPSRPGVQGWAQCGYKTLDCFRP